MAAGQQKRKQKERGPGLMPERAGRAVWHSLPQGPQWTAGEASLQLSSRTGKDQGEEKAWAAGNYIEDIINPL